MMITEQSRLLSRIQSCLSLDPQEPTSLRIQIDKITHYLHEFRIFIPPRQFEEAMRKFMKDSVVGKVQLGHPGTFPAIAKAILVLADRIIDEATKNIEVLKVSEDEVLTEEIQKYLKEKGSRHTKKK